MMTQRLHNKALMATVKEAMSTHQSISHGGGEGKTTEEEEKRSQSSSDGGSSVSSEQCLLLSPKEREARPPPRHELSLDLSLDSYPSTDSLHVLDELLCDIRRSCTASLTSTPILLSSDGEVTGAEAAVFECKLRRSGTELRAMSKSVSRPRTVVYG